MVSWAIELKNIDLKMLGNSPFKWLFDKSKIPKMLGLLLLHNKDTKSENLLLERCSAVACNKMLDASLVIGKEESNHH